MNRRLLCAALIMGLVASMAAAPASAAKKKKPKPPPPPPCAVYTPGEQGAEGEVTVVTDAATEAAPLEMEVEAHPGLALTAPDDPTSGHSYYNVQVDTSLPEAGLFVRLEWSGPPVRDYDLWLNYADGTNASNAHGFNPDHAGPFSPTSDGGHTEPTAEQIDGTHSADCQGYTLDVATSMAEGGTLTLKMWLGEIQYHPGG